MGYFSRALCTLSCDWLIAWLIVIVFQAISGLPCASVSKRVHLKMSMIRMKMNQQEGNISMWMQYAFAGGHRQLRNAFLFVDLPFGRAITSCLCTSLLNGLQVQRISIEWEFYVSKQLQKRMNARGCSKELVSLSLKCSPKLVVCNRCQSSPSLTILVSS